MSEDKKYQRKGHVHTDKKKEPSKRAFVQQHDWYCTTCKEYTDYSFDYNCSDCGNRMIFL